MQELIGWRPLKTIGPDNGAPGVESMLDIEYLSSVSGGLPMIVFSTSVTHGGQEPFLVWVQTVLKLADADLPQVISVSYGDVEASLTADYMMRLDAEFAKVGLRGTSILFAAGDSGAACNNDGTKFQPDFPASAPHVTTVGGTELSGLLETGPEVMNSIGGGGLSNVFPMPDWQKTAYSKWRQQAGTDAPAKFFNATGRAYPDIAGLSSGFWVVTDLVPQPVGGTSCAAPSLSAIVSLVNEHRLAGGKQPLGFLNPLLYAQGNKNSAIFNKVRAGCNMGCGANNGIGFCALKSGFFSPAGGWGSLNYREMIKLP
eukprot:TRINITY_DN3477_c0_g1_i1.p2 TRINITY_DN3477_c0_g1~~TRINITY_DN3477_c0_g1_i1.p2  ORF type:complete len:314 (-),score=167.68 TRINITY_DN3477_c0_g1_i1:27-968(-)